MRAMDESIKMLTETDYTQFDFRLPKEIGDEDGADHEPRVDEIVVPIAER